MERTPSEKRNPIVGIRQNILVGPGIPIPQTLSYENESKKYKKSNGARQGPESNVSASGHWPTPGPGMAGHAAWSTGVLPARPLWLAEGGTAQVSPMPGSNRSRHMITVRFE